MRHFIDLRDAGPERIAAILNDAAARKNARAGWPKGRADADAPLDGHVLAMTFEKHGRWASLARRLRFGPTRPICADDD